MNIVSKFFVFFGSAALFLGCFKYIFETIKGNTKPNKVSWLLWAAAPLIASFVAFFEGEGLSVFPVFFAGFLSLVIFILSFLNKNSYWHLEKFDYLCGAFSILALILWWITNQPEIVIVFAILSDIFAALPTFIKTWKQPETENIFLYIGGTLNALSAFPLIKEFCFATVAFPLYLVLMCSLMVVFISKKHIYHFLFNSN